MKTNRRTRAYIALALASMVLAISLYAHFIWELRALQARIDTAKAKLETLSVQMAEPTRSDELAAVEEPEPAVVEEPELEILGEFKLTAYCPCEKCCGEWADGITYTGTRATEGRTVAVDPSVIPLGSTVRINGHDYIAEDIGGAIKANRVDVFFDTHQDALQFGVQYADVAIIQ